LILSVAEENAQRVLVAALPDLFDGLTQKELAETAATLIHALNVRGHHIVPFPRERAEQ
jgi:hypothetical protein